MGAFSVTSLGRPVTAIAARLCTALAVAHAWQRDEPGRRHRRFRLLLAAGRRRGARSVDDPVRRAERTMTIGTLAGRRGRVRAPARRRPPLSRRTGAVPGQPLGAALARRPPGRVAVGRRVADARRSDRARWSCPISSSTGPAAGRTPIFDAGDGCRAHLLRRPVLPARTGGGAGGDEPAGRRRHAGRGQRPALLVARRVAGVPVARLVDHRHDRDARGGAGPRARRSVTRRSRWSPISTPASRRARA